MSDTKQFHSHSDDCIYFFDEKLSRYRKICDIGSPSDLPLDVKEQIRNAQIEAEYILKLPL